MTKTCHFCKAGLGAYGNVNAAHYDAELGAYLPERINVCAADACRNQIARAPRRPRQPRQARPLYGDFAMLAKFHGIKTDGTGRRAR